MRCAVDSHAVEIGVQCNTIPTAARSDVLCSALWQEGFPYIRRWMAELAARAAVSSLLGD